MKRWIGSLVLMSSAALAAAQAPFTIVRPADGARVREKVRVQIPKGSIPPGGYVGVFLNDKFLEAVVPPLRGKFYEYVLDTKGRGLVDTAAGQKDKLELVLYQDTEAQSRVLDRSSVEVRISNYSSIDVPNDGLNLRYRFTPGQELVYQMTQKTTISEQSEEQSLRGSKAGTLAEAEGEQLRLSYAVVNSYGNGDGLLRMQAMPKKGKDYFDYTIRPEEGQKRYYDVDIAPVYMRVSKTGHEVFGALPPYTRLMESSIAGGFDLYAAFPLPTLPEKAVRPGDSWRSRFQQGALDLTKLYEMSSVIARRPARGEFVRVEWERGHPCAVLRNVIEAGEKSPDAEKLANNGDEIQGDKTSISETYWFAMDTRQILKIVRDTTIDRKNVSSAGGSAFGGTRGGGPGMPGGMPPGRGGKAGGGGDDFFQIPSSSTMKQRRPSMGGGQGGPPGYGGPNGPGGYPGGMGGRTGGGFPGQGGAAQTSTTFMRIRIQQTFTLE